MAHLHSRDPENRFCAQCGERRTAADPAGDRCADCRATPVPARFCRRAGARLDPPPPPPRTTLASYLGGLVAGNPPEPLPTVDGLPHYARGSKLSAEWSRPRT